MKNKNRITLRAAVGAAVLAAAAAEAQIGEGEAAVVRGPFMLGSSIGLERRRDDNVFNSATARQADNITLLTPSLQLQLEPSRHLLRLSYEGEYGRHERLGNDDYDDHSLEAGAGVRLGERSLFEFTAAAADQHEARGTGLTEGFDPRAGTLPIEPDRYAVEELEASFSHGLRDDGVRLRFETGRSALEYENNEVRTAFFDRRVSFAGAVLTSPVGTSTFFVFDVRSTDYEYERLRPSGASLDSREYRYLAGLQWDATSKTSGSVRVGWLSKEFADAARAGYSAPSWEVDVRWSPRTYSHVDVGTERTAEETTDLTGDTTETTTTSVRWTHAWSPRLESSVGVTLIDEKFRGTGTVREQDARRAAAALAYRVRSWLELELGVEEHSRDSTIDRFSFDGGIARLGLRVIF